MLSFVPRPFANRRYAWILASILLSGLIVSRAAAQSPSESPKGNQREQLFQQLFREVDEFQRHHSLLKKLFKLVSPSVVHLDAEVVESGRNGGKRTVQEAGSGVIIELQQKTYVVTNRHVIKDASLANITIRFSDGNAAHPTQLWADRDTDLAVLAVSVPNLVAARLGDSEQAEIGDFVAAVGSPFGLSHSVTYGIISAKGRRDLELGDGGVRYQDFIQTDAAINPGNSGGPLFNLRGEAIGINTAIASNSGGSEGIGFAIPINMTMKIVRQLVDRGNVVRGKLGVTLDSKFTYDKALNAGLTRLVGARVIGVGKNSSAEQAGIRDGDVIVRFDGLEVENDTHLVNIVATTLVGADIAAEVYRDRKPQRVTVKLIAP